MDYKATKTWLNTLGKEDQAHYEEIERLRSSYGKVRDRAAELAGEISSKLPFFTKHDITHSDALWDMADLLLWDGEKLCSLNPAEAYTLGLSFLLHDLGMGLAAYPEGMDELRKQQLFQDSLASEFLREYDRPVGEADQARLEKACSDPEAEDRKLVERALRFTLRELHAQKAAKLGLQSWPLRGENVYLIDDLELREAYGELASRIAASHGESYDALREAFSNTPLGAPGILPQDWTVDAVKLAVILRLADALQLDDRRAPSFLMALRRPIGESGCHWIFQNKLNRPTAAGDRICYSSKSAFKSEEMDAWWLCHDILRGVDEELRAADLLLQDTGRERMIVRGVYGVASAKTLSERIRTEGWTPVDTAIRVGDVGRLVRTLGGEQLYGKDSEWVPFRELIQNASDAIRARRLLEDREPNYGDIEVFLEERGGKHWIHFTDNGVGMSETVLTGPFLDFGGSFWNSSLMNRELPGLSSKSFRSTGRYGIGFYSVFMWSGAVTVITRRIGDDRRTLALEFRDSVNSRPILRDPTETERRAVRDGGTRVSVRITEQKMQDIRNGRGFPCDNRPLADALAFLCPALDCNLYLKEENARIRTPIIRANDWLNISPEVLFRRTASSDNERDMPFSADELKKLLQNMEIINSEAGPLGRAAFAARNSVLSPQSFGCMVSGGLFSHRNWGFIGVIEGTSTGAARNRTSLQKHETELVAWMESQRDRLEKRDFSKRLQAELADYIIALQLDPGELCIAECGKGFVNMQQIAAMAQNNKSCDRFIILQDAAVTMKTRDLRGKALPRWYDNVLWCSVGACQNPLSPESDVCYLPDPTGRWVEYSDYFEPSRFYKTLAYYAIEAVCHGFGIDDRERNRHILHGSDTREYKAVVGEVDGKELTMNVSTIIFRHEITDPDIEELIV